MGSSGSRKFKTLKRKLANWIRGVARQAGIVGEFLLACLLFPFRIVLFPFTLIKELRDRGIETREKAKQDVANLSFTRRAIAFPKKLFLFPFAGLVWVYRRLRNANPWELAFATPAVLTVIFLLGAITWRFVKADSIEKKYRTGASAAFTDGDFELARTYFERLPLEDMIDSEKYAWASILARTGDRDKANSLIEELAPDFEKGFAPAHRRRALSAAKLVKSSPGSKEQDPTILQRLKWHLDHSGEKTPELNAAWVTYLWEIGDVDGAITYLNDLARKDPKYFIDVASIHNQRGEALAMAKSLEQAEKAYRRRLEKDPFDHASRVALANVLVRQKKPVEAHPILAKGMKLQPDDYIRRAYADSPSAQCFNSSGRFGEGNRAGNRAVGIAVIT